MRSRSRELGAVLAMTLAIAACASGAGTISSGSTSSAMGEAPPSASGDGAARDAARAFLDRYVEPDGRVARHDQGDETVSEGQSYALVLALVAGDDERFGRVWQWTATHLHRSDELLASHVTADGAIEDGNPATDADLVTAWALLRAGGPAADALHDAGRRLAAAVLDRESVHVAGNRFALAAGTWATDSPATLNPSYWALPLLHSLRQLTGDTRWDDAADGAVAIVDQLTNGGRQLPPDWARADAASAAPLAGADGRGPRVQYSYDAQRVVPWFAVSGGRAAALASAWSPLLDGDRCGAAALALDGATVDRQQHPMALVASAAAAQAAGHYDVRDQRLDEATAMDRAHPTYYGAAWIALGRALLTTKLLNA